MTTPSDGKPQMLRVFVNGNAIDVARGASASDVVRTWSPAAAEAVARGDQVINDSRGLPVRRDLLVEAGSIFRVVRAPRRDSGSPPDDSDEPEAGT
jgi:hypothetical protein